jgi:hypothetical protein
VESGEFDDSELNSEGEEKVGDDAVDEEDGWDASISDDEDNDEPSDVEIVD